MDNFVRIAIFSVVILLVASSDILGAFTSPKTSGESAAAKTGHENYRTVTSSNDVSDLAHMVVPTGDAVSEGRTAVNDGGLHISFCTSNVAMQVRLALQQQYPWLEVTLSNYPPPPLNVLLSKALGAGQFLGLALTFAGDRILPALGFAELPAWYLRMQGNKLGCAAGIWILGNVAHNMLISTGAFEISYGGSMIFSKLEEKAMPAMEDLMHRVDISLQSAGAMPATA